MYPFEHEGKRYQLSEITNDIRLRYCAWLRKKMYSEAKELDLAPEDMATFMDRLTGGAVSWSVNASSAVQESLDTDIGRVQLVRLMLGAVGESLSDEAMLVILIGCPAAIDALKMATENSLPKALMALATSPGPKDSTEPSAPSPATPSGNPSPASSA
jgi:hypothetical protein